MQKGVRVLLRCPHCPGTWQRHSSEILMPGFALFRVVKRKEVLFYHSHETAEADMVALGIAIDSVSCRKKVSHAFCNCFKAGTEERKRQQDPCTKHTACGSSDTECLEEYLKQMFKMTQRQTSGEARFALHFVKYRGGKLSNSKLCCSEDPSMFLIPDAFQVFKGLTC